MDGKPKLFVDDLISGMNINNQQTLGTIHILINYEMKNLLLS